MEQRIVLITGANKGIGFETARQLGAAGLTVLVGARGEERGRTAAEKLAAEGTTARFVPLDVTDEASVTAAAAWIEAEYGRLDVLVNNAGISSDGLNSPPPSRTTVAAVRATYETNVFGVIAVTNAMLPLLRGSAAGRIVNVSSSLGSLSRVTDPAGPGYAVNLLPYNTSKSALNAVTIAYAKELADSGIKVNAVTPGHCATDLNDHSGPRTAAQGGAVVAGHVLADGPETGGYFNEDGRLAW